MKCSLVISNFLEEINNLLLVKLSAHTQAVQTEARGVGRWTLITWEQKQLDPRPRKKMGGCGNPGSPGCSDLFLCCPQVRHMKNTWWREHFPISVAELSLYNRPKRSALCLIAFYYEEAKATPPNF